MSLPQSLLDEIGKLDDDQIYTPETIAWRLLLHDTGSSILTSMLETYSEGNDNEQNQDTFYFEILITIMMELIFDMMKLDFYSNNTGDFTYDMENIDIEPVIKLVKQKFNKIHVIAHIKS